MATKKLAEPSAAELRKAFKTDLATAWEYSKNKHPGHTPYAFVLYGVEGGPPSFMPCVLTEESLTSVAQKYVANGHHDTLEEARESLRYSVADSPFCSELNKFTTTVDGILKPFAKSLDEEKGYKLLAQAAMVALAALDEKGLFGVGERRKKLLLVIITEGTECDWSDASAKKLNPPAIYKKFKDDTKVEGTFASSVAFAMSPDGLSLYSTGSGTNLALVKGKDKSCNELVACDIRGPRLVPRWRFQFPSFGDTGSNILCTPDGKHVLFLRSRIDNADGVVKGVTVFMRFSTDNQTPLNEHVLPGWPTGIAINADGSTIVICTGARSRNTLHFFDRDLKPLRTLAFEHLAQDLLFLRNGDLLLATPMGVLRLAPRSDHATTFLSGSSFHLSVDETEKLLAVSKNRYEFKAEGAKPKEFGVQIYDLKSAQRRHEFIVPGCTAEAGVLSPDGSLLVCDVWKIDGARQFGVVFDVATGEEIARRKGDWIKQRAFLRDSRTVAVAESGFTLGVPIALWKIAR